MIHSKKHPQLKGLHGAAYQKAWRELNPETARSYKLKPKGLCDCGNVATKVSCGDHVCARCEALESQRRIGGMIKKPDVITQPKPFKLNWRGQVQRAWIEFRNSIIIQVPEIESYADRCGYYEPYDQRHHA